MPPWIHTITGRPAAPGSGVHTLRFRQSCEADARSTASNAPATSPQSSPAPESGSPVEGGATCGGSGPSRVASRTPLQRSTGCGGRSRRSPNGGAAYGTPRNTWTPSATLPRTAPRAVWTTAPAGAASTPAGIRAHHTPPRARTGVPASLPSSRRPRQGDDELTRRSHRRGREKPERPFAVPPAPPRPRAPTRPMGHRSAAGGCGRPPPVWAVSQRRTYWGGLSLQYRSVSVTAV